MIFSHPKAYLIHHQLHLNLTIPSPCKRCEALEQEVARLQEIVKSLQESPKGRIEQTSTGSSKPMPLEDFLDWVEHSGCPSRSAEDEEDLIQWSDSDESIASASRGPHLAQPYVPPHLSVHSVPENHTLHGQNKG